MWQDQSFPQLLYPTTFPVFTYAPKHTTHKDVKQTSNFRTKGFKLEYELNLHTFGIRMSDWNLLIVVT